MASCSRRLIDFFSCRRENPALLQLIQKFPNIDAKAIVRSHLRKALDESDVQDFTARVQEESDLRDELGHDVYDALLARMETATLIGFASNAARFNEFSSRELSDWHVDLQPYPTKQRVTIYHRLGNQKAFWEQVPQRLLARHSLDQVRRVVGQSFPRFQEGILSASEEDWADIDTVLSAMRWVSPGKPQNVLVFDQYLQNWRGVDFLERERHYAAQANYPGDAYRDLAIEIQRQKAKLREGPSFLQQEDLDRAFPPIVEDYSVFPVGDILQDGKFAIVDWTNVSPWERNSIHAKLTPDLIRGWVGPLRPGQPLSFDQEQNQLSVTENGRCQLFYETAESVRQVFRDLDFKEGSRLARKGLRDIRKPWARNIELGHYRRISKPVADADIFESFSRRSRTAIVDRREAIATVDQLRKTILQGHSDQLDWNKILQLSDYLEGIKLNDLMRSREGYDWDPEFMQALRQFNEISPSLESLVKERTLVQFLETAFREGKRKYDLATGVKQLAEVARIFRDWVQAMETMLAAMGNREVEADFHWFRVELHRILPRFREFVATLPEELIALDRMSPSQIRERLQPGALERVIERALDCLNQPFYQTLPTLLCPLQLAQSGRVFERAKAKILARHQAKLPFINAVQVALPNAFQVPCRVENCLIGLARALSKPSPLYPKILQTYHMAKQKALESEKVRVIEARRLLGRSKELALERYYPTIKLRK